MIKITEHGSGSITIRRGPLSPVVFTPDEQRELLEALARIQGFSLVDREERSALRGFALDIMEDGQYPPTSLPRLLAEEVASALGIETEED